MTPSKLAQFSLTKSFCSVVKAYPSCLLTQGCVSGAPLVITEDLIKTFNISLVVRGTVSESHNKGGKDDERYAYPKSNNIFR